MSTSRSISTTVSALAIALVLFASPASSQAASVSISGSLTCIGGLLAGAAGAAASAAVSVPISSAVSDPANSDTAFTNKAKCINDVILMPLARSMARDALRQLTSVSINYINNGNGNGRPSFVTNLSANLQGATDAAVGVSGGQSGFIGQVSNQLGASFGPTISSYLKTNYLQGSSQAGFYAANQDTLTKSSPNYQTDYLQGNYAHGGVASWLSLSTDNSPYVKAANAQQQLQTTVTQTRTNRTAEYVAGNGFLSLCNGSLTQAAVSAAVNPGDPCISASGVQGVINTPGSIVKAVADKVTTTPFNQLVSAQDMDASLSSIADTLISQVIGGATGFFGASISSGGGQAPLTTQIQSTASASSNSVSSAAALADQVLAQITTYTNAWNTLGNAAQTASTTVQTLLTTCTDNIAKAQNISSNNLTQSKAISDFLTLARTTYTSAQSVLTSNITPVIAQQQTALTSVSSAIVLANKVKTEASQITAGATAGTATSLTTLNADVQALSNIGPSSADLAIAQQQSSATGGASANPTGSLTISGGTLLDQMNLINTNATGLITSACTLPAGL